MKKKFLTALLCVAACLCLCFGLAACGEEAPKTPSDTTQTETGGGNNNSGGDNNNSFHVHAYGDWEIIVPATHTTTGTRRKYCSCGEHIDEPIAKTTAHEYGNWQTTREATHLVAGEKQRTCPCGAVETDTIPKTTAHEYGNWQISREATHLLEGEKQRTCPCGAVETDVIPKTTAHEYGNWQITREATHLVAGEKQRTCPCGEIETETIPKTTAHTFLPYSIQDATCTAAGEEVLRCECGEEQRNTIPQKKHTYDHCECTVCGAVKPGAVSVEVYIDDMLSDTLYTDDEYDHKIQLPEKIVEDEYYFDAWYGNTEYMQPLTGQETYRSAAKIYGRRIMSSVSDYDITVNAGEATIEKFRANTATAVVIPSYYYGYPITCIGTEAFKDKTMIRWLIITSPMETVGNWAFEGCNSMKKVVLSDSVTMIGYQAFKGCYGLESVKIGNGVKSISYQAFGGCWRLTSVTIENGEIGQEAFMGCSGLTSIIIGSGVTEVGMDAFLYCDEIKRIYYKGTPSEWRGVSFGPYISGSHINDNSKFASVPCYYFSDQTPTAEQWEESENWWHYDEDGTTIILWTK